MLKGMSLVSASGQNGILEMRRKTVERTVRREWLEIFTRNG